MSHRFRSGSLAALPLVLLLGCYSPVSTPSGVELIPSPVPSEVERVLFLLGDAGLAISPTSPLLQRMTQDVEWWSQQLESDSSVAVLLLGDIIYPLGLNPPESSSFDNDTAVVMGQVRLVGGPWAVQRGSRAFFLAGNHDWGLREDFEGFVRIAALDTYLEGARARTGANVDLAPSAGSGGPVVLDWGLHHRLVLLDTAWWLLEGRFAERQVVLQGIEEAFATAGDRELLIAAHHPFLSGGPHGGGFSFWETLGVRYVLYRSGAFLQDLSSRPYRELDSGLRAIFTRHGPPLAFIGGHEHSLQVIEGEDEDEPRYNLVSGSGSKLTEVGPVDGLVFAQASPGYMRMVFMRNGDVGVFVEAGSPDHLTCPSGEPERTECMAEGTAAFQTVYSRWLR